MAIYRYFHEKYSVEIHFFVPPFLSFTARTAHHSTHIVANQPHSHHIPSVRSVFRSNSFFLWTTGLWKRFPRGCFPFATILTCPSLALTATFWSYPYKQPPNVTLCLEWSLYLVNLSGKSNNNKIYKFTNGGKFLAHFSSFVKLDTILEGVLSRCSDKNVYSGSSTWLLHFLIYPFELIFAMSIHLLISLSHFPLI